MLTPNLEKFAKKSVVFKNAYTSVPVCHPARTALLSGLKATTSGINANESPNIRSNPKYVNLVTLPQMFKNNGYTTLKNGKIYHELNGKDDPQSWKESRSDLGTAFPANPADRTDHGMIFDGYHATEWGLRWGYSADQTVEATGDGTSALWIAEKIKTMGSKSFFLAYGASKPHLPWYAPKSFFDLYKQDTLVLPEVLANDLGDVPFPTKSNSRQSEFLRTKNWKNGVHAYLANVSFADACVGKVLDALDKSPLSRCPGLPIMWYLYRIFILPLPI